VGGGNGRRGGRGRGYTTLVVVRGKGEYVTRFWQGLGEGGQGVCNCTGEAGLTGKISPPLSSSRSRPMAVFAFPPAGHLLPLPPITSAPPPLRIDVAAALPTQHHSTPSPAKPCALAALPPLHILPVPLPGISTQSPCNPPPFPFLPPHAPPSGDKTALHGLRLLPRDARHARARARRNHGGNGAQIPAGGPHATYSHALKTSLATLLFPPPAHGGHGAQS
jgi:hypothetical protein